MANYTDGYIDIAARSGDDAVDLNQPALVRVTTDISELDVIGSIPEVDPTPSQEAYNEYINARNTLASLTSQKSVAISVRDAALVYSNRSQKALNDLDDALATAAKRLDNDPGFRYKYDLIQTAHENAAQEYAVANAALDAAEADLEAITTDIESAIEEVTLTQDALIAPELEDAYVIYPDYNKIYLFFSTPVQYVGGAVDVTDNGDSRPIRGITQLRSDIYVVTLADPLTMVTSTSSFDTTIIIDAGTFRNPFGKANAAVLDFLVTPNLTWTMEEANVTAPIAGACPAWLANISVHKSTRFSDTPLPELFLLPDPIEFVLGYQCSLDSKAATDNTPDFSTTTLQPNDFGLASVHLAGQVVTHIPVIADTQLNTGQACDFVQVAKEAGTPARFHITSTEVCAPLGGGSAGKELIIGAVVGGNASSLLPPGKVIGTKGKENYSVPSSADATEPDELGFVDADYPVNRSYAFPLPTLNKNNQLKVLPRVNRWDRYELPSTYKMGDKLPRLPDGLCYVRLVRPYSWNGKRWDANYDQVPESDSLLMYPRAVRLKDNVLKVYYPSIPGFVKLGTFLQDPSRNTPPGAAFVINSTLKDAQGSRLVVTNYSDLVNGVVTLTLSFAPDPMDLLIGLSMEIAGSIFIKPGVEATENTEAIEAVASGAATLFIEGSGDANTIVLAMNRDGLQGFKQGDYVIMRDDNLDIQDHVQLAGTAGTTSGYPAGPTTGMVSKSVLTIIGSVSGGLPLHTHTNNGGGIAGGGISNLSSLV
jgi:hypothetical protein